MPLVATFEGLRGYGPMQESAPSAAALAGYGPASSVPASVLANTPDMMTSMFVKDDGLAGLGRPPDAAASMFDDPKTTATDNEDGTEVSARSALARDRKELCYATERLTECLRKLRELDAKVMRLGAGPERDAVIAHRVSIAQAAVMYAQNRADATLLARDAKLLVEAEAELESAMEDRNGVEAMRFRKVIAEIQAHRKGLLAERMANQRNWDVEVSGANDVKRAAKIGLLMKDLQMLDKHIMKVRGDLLRATQLPLGPKRNKAIVFFQEKQTKLLSQREDTAKKIADLRSEIAARQPASGMNTGLQGWGLAGFGAGISVGTGGGITTSAGNPAKNATDAVRSRVDQIGQRAESKDIMRGRAGVGPGSAKKKPTPAVRKTLKQLKAKSVRPTVMKIVAPAKLQRPTPEQDPMRVKMQVVDSTNVALPAAATTPSETATTEAQAPAVVENATPPTKEKGFLAKWGLPAGAAAALFFAFK